MPFGKSIHLEEFSMLGFIIQTVCCSKKNFSRDLGSPGSRQLLQLQLFPNFFFKFWTLLLISFFLGLFGLLNSVFVFPLLQIWIVWSWSEVNCFHAFRETVFVYQCFGLWGLKLIWKWCPFDPNDFLHCYRKSIYVWVGALVLYVAAISKNK